MGRNKMYFSNEELVSMARNVIDKYESGEQSNPSLMCEDFATFAYDVINSLSRNEN